MRKYKTGYGIERRDKKLIRAARKIWDCALISHDLQNLAYLNMEAKNAHKTKKSSVNFYDNQVKNQVNKLRRDVVGYQKTNCSFKMHRR